MFGKRDMSKVQVELNKTLVKGGEADPENAKDLNSAAFGVTPCLF